MNRSQTIRIIAVVGALLLAGTAWWWYDRSLPGYLKVTLDSYLLEDERWTVSGTESLRLPATLVAGQAMDVSLEGRFPVGDISFPTYGKSFITLLWFDEHARTSEPVQTSGLAEGHGSVRVRKGADNGTVIILNGRESPASPPPSQPGTDPTRHKFSGTVAAPPRPGRYRVLLTTDDQSLVGNPEERLGIARFIREFIIDVTEK